MKGKKHSELLKQQQKQRSILFDLDAQVNAQKSKLYILENEESKLKKSDKRRHTINEEKSKLVTDINQIESDMLIYHQNMNDIRDQIEFYKELYTDFENEFYKRRKKENKKNEDKKISEENRKRKRGDKKKKPRK